MSKEEQLKLNLDKAYQLIQRAYKMLDDTEKHFYLIIETNAGLEDEVNDMEYRQAEEALSVCKRELEEFEMLNGHEIEELLK